MERLLIAVFILPMVFASCGKVGTLTLTPVSSTTTSSLSSTTSVISLVINDNETIAVEGGSSPYTYAISSGGGSLSNSVYTAPASAGSATVTVTDSSGQTLSIAITINSALSVTTSSSAVYSNQTATLTPTGGVSPYTYSVVSGTGTVLGTTFTAAATGASISSVQVTDSDSNTAAVTVTTVENPVYWLRPETLVAAAIGDGATFSNWPDSSVNNNTGRANGGREPTFHSSGGLMPNSNPYVAFDGTDCVISNSTYAGFGDYTVFAVYQDDGVVSAWEKVIAQTWMNGWSFSRAGASTNFDHYLNGSVGPTTANLPDGNWHIAMIDRNGANSSIYYNGTFEQTRTPSAAATAVDEIAVGCMTDDSQFFTGYGAEYLVYDSYLGATDRDNIFCYLGDKYGITVSQVCP